MNGILVINKEKEFTSFDVIAIVRKYLKVKKAGHTGTLDPNATGVLPVLIGNATKAQDILDNQDKEYIADFKFGISTDTEDVWGNVLKEEHKRISKEELEKTLSKFTGEILQTPPMYSAKSVNGQRLYTLARQGIEIERKSVPIKIFSLSLLSFDEEKGEGKLSISCSKGTYVRTLITDIAKELGTIAVMTDLVRTKASGFSIDEAITINQFKEYVEDGTIEKYIQSVESLFVNKKEVFVSTPQSIRLKNGNYLDLVRLKDKNLKDKEIVRVKHDDEFISLGIVDKENNRLKIYKHF